MLFIQSRMSDDAGQGGEAVLHPAWSGITPWSPSVLSSPPGWLSPAEKPEEVTAEPTWKHWQP